MQGTFIDGKYQVIRQLGQGGMGAVYEARHRSTGRKVAVKVIVPAALAGGLEIIARFEREARASGSIDSPFVVQVLDAGVDSATGAPYMAMECLSGEDVQAAIARLGPLSPDVVLRITAHACHGLHKAHEAGIVHRDIKSANLFLARREADASEILTKILDFGIAKVRASPLPDEDHKLTKTGTMLGSPVYMSPEQAIGAKGLDARSDIFSMGVMMYEALSGATPNGHLENLGALLMAICSQQAPSLQDRAPWIPADVAAIVHKALALKPEDRYQSAAELRAAAVALLPGGGTTLLESMLVPLSDAMKSRCAPRLAPIQTSAEAFAATTVPVPTSSTPNLTAPAAPVSAATGAAMSTTAGLGMDDVSPVGVPRPFRWAAVVVALFAVVAFGGGGAYFVQHRAPAAPEKPLGLVPADAPILSASPPDVARTESVTVSPAEATVEIDGKSAAVVGGRFDLTGAVGSVHDVRILLAGADKHVKVAITTTGAVPDSVALTPRPGVVPPTSPATGPRAPIAARPGAAPGPVTAAQPAPQLVVTPPPGPAAPPPPAPRQPAGPVVDRQM